jgi:hypothetical protein
MAGNGPLLMLATLKEYVPAFAPKLVLWFYYEGNDLTDLHTEKKSGLLMRYWKDDFRQGLRARQSDIDQALTRDIDRQKALEAANRVRREKNSSRIGNDLLAFVKLSKLRQKLSLVYGMGSQELETLSAWEGPNIDFFREILSQAETQVHAWGGQLYFVYLPVGDRSWVKTKRGSVLAMVESLRIPIVDIDPAFQASGDPLSLFPFHEANHHYNEIGHRLVAQEVLQAIAQSPAAQQ